MIIPNRKPPWCVTSLTQEHIANILFPGTLDLHKWQLSNGRRVEVWHSGNIYDLIVQEQENGDKLQYVYSNG
jgi:hypothetical protein